LATRLATLLDRAGVQPDVTGSFRAGDIRHCWADVSRARTLLGFTATADRDAELRRLAAWVVEQTPVDRTEAAFAELAARGLIRPASASASPSGTR
jgi:dTDP-L-rhamnose 4-epimerase